MPAVCFPAFIKNNCVFCRADHRLAPPLSRSSSPGQHKPRIPRRDYLCLPLPTSTDRRQTRGPLLFLLWFLAASARFLRVYHCNQQARPAVSQAAWNKAAWAAEHKVGEAFLFGCWEQESVLSLSAWSLFFLFFLLIDLLKNEDEEQLASFPPQKRNSEQQKLVLNMFKLQTQLWGTLCIFSLIVSWADSSLRLPETFRIAHLKLNHYPSRRRYFCLQYTLNQSTCWYANCPGQVAEGVKHPENKGVG